MSSTSARVASAAPPASVDPRRKHSLLLEARADRLRWIQSVPLPLKTFPLSDDDGVILPPTYASKHLPSVQDVLVNLYGSEEVAKRRIQQMLPSSSDADYSKAVPSGSEVLEQALQDSSPSLNRQTLEAYQKLLQKLQAPEFAALVNGMRNFQRKLSLQTNLKAPALAKAFQSYISTTFESLSMHESILPSLESFLYGQAHDTLWSCVQDEKARDKDCLERCQSLAFLEPIHLDIACLDGDNAQLPTETLLSLQQYYSPYEKLQRILQTYHGVNSTLQQALNAKESGGEQKLPSADDVLPTLILTVLRAQPSSIVSNLRFIELYATQEHLRGEAGYAFTNLYGAVQFLLDLDISDKPSSSLTISPEEYRNGVQECRKKMETKQKELKQLQQQQQVEETSEEIATKPPSTVSIPVSQVRAARLRGETVDLEWARQYHKENLPANAVAAAGQSNEESEELLPPGFARTYSFLATKAEDVHMTDLPQLLDEYRMLAKTVEVLLSERAARIAAERKQRMHKAERAMEMTAVQVGMSITPTTKKDTEQDTSQEPPLTTTASVDEQGQEEGHKDATVHAPKIPDLE